MVDYVPPEGVPLRWLLTYNETESEEDDGSWLGGTRRVFGRDAPMLYFCMVSAPLILFMLWKLKLCFRRRTGEIPAAWEVPGRAQVADGAPPAPARADFAGRMGAWFVRGGGQASPCQREVPGEGRGGCVCVRER